MVIVDFVDKLRQGRLSERLEIRVTPTFKERLVEDYRHRLRSVDPGCNYTLSDHYRYLLHDALARTGNNKAANG